MRNDITWRGYRQSDIYFKDLDAVVLLHHETEQSLGMKMDLPNLARPPILGAWVAERDGIVVGGFYCELVIEPVFFGTDPEVSASARRFVPTVLGALSQRGFRLVRMEVPRWIGEKADSINRELEKVGFKSTDESFHHYLYDLRQGNGRNGRQ